MKTTRIAIPFPSRERQGVVRLNPGTRPGGISGGESGGGSLPGSHDPRRSHGGFPRIPALKGGEVVRAAAHIGCRTSSQSAGQVGTT